MSSELQGGADEPRGSLIIVTGMPATGKSRLARQLGAALDLPLLAKDAFKEPLLTALATTPATSRMLSDLSFELLFLLAPAVLGDSARRGVILEGNFRRGQHESGIAPLVAGTQRCVQLLCRVDEGARRARLAARVGDASRHPGHRDGEAALQIPPAVTDQFLDLPGEKRVLGGNAPQIETDILIRDLGLWLYSDRCLP